MQWPHRMICFSSVCSPLWHTAGANNLQLSYWSLHYCYKEQLFLQDFFNKINNACFENKLQSYVRWGTHASKTSYQTNCSDEQGKTFSLITIAGIYNHPSVPEFALYSVMYHEMLHIFHPVDKVNGRRIVHSKQFKAQEILFKEYTLATKWLNKKLWRVKFVL